uniref:DUF4097 family beta strand repeat-containing protein n=1 Tax=Acetatifactor sp. TaxID=1872090 RepID=UPI00405662FD
MKKFMKVCVLIALILLVLGFALAFWAGSAEGAYNVNEIVESVTDGKVHINWGDSDSWGITVGEMEWGQPQALFDINDNTIFDNNYEIYENSIDKYSVGNSVKGLDIETGGCAFLFRLSGDNDFYLEATDAGKFQCYIEDDILYVKSTRTIVEDWNEYKEGKIMLYIPENYNFDEVNAELGAGLLEIQNLTAAKVDLEVGAGQIIIEDLKSEDCDIEVGMGEMIVNNMNITKLNAEVGMGHLQMNGAILGNADMECSMGAITLDLTGSEKDFNYTVDAAMGNVSIGGEEYSGLTQEKSVNHSASKQITLDCAMGNIEVDFEE